MADGGTKAGRKKREEEMKEVKEGYKREKWIGCKGRAKGDTYKGK